MQFLSMFFSTAPELVDKAKPPDHERRAAANHCYTKEQQRQRGALRAPGLRHIRKRRERVENPHFLVGVPVPLAQRRPEFVKFQPKVAVCNKHITRNRRQRRHSRVGATRSIWLFPGLERFKRFFLLAGLKGIEKLIRLDRRV